MKWFILFVGIVVLCGVAALLLGRLGGGLGAATSTLSHEPLPDDPLTDDDLDELRFDVALRGYRMSQVDGVLARLRRELHEKDEELAVLRGESSSTVHFSESRVQHSESRVQGPDEQPPSDSSQTEGP